MYGNGRSDGCTGHHMTRPVLSLSLVGAPVPWARARTRNGRHFTAPAVLAAQQAIRDAWEAAGAVRLPDEPLALEVTARFARPPGHYGVRGNLSAAGRKAIPGGAKDVDNIIKLVADSLQGCAFSNDRLVTIAHGEKRWAARGEAPRLDVLAWAIEWDAVMRP
jgi:Holliday junction resolvase RusA-like endonuclease